MRLRALITLCTTLCCIATGRAQMLDISDMQDDFDKFVKEITDDFYSFRRQAMADYAEFVRNPWKAFEAEPPVKKPEMEPIPPVVIPDNEIDKPIEDRPVVIDQVVIPVVPAPEPKPQPVEPIDEVPTVSPKYVDFKVFGTKMKVRCDADALPHMSDVSAESVSRSLQRLASEDNDNTILDCLDIRDTLGLSDWAYLQMLVSLAGTVYPDSENDAELLTAYLYMMSGYKMRLGNDGSNLYMLFASKHDIFGKPRFVLDGTNYYCFLPTPNTLQICQAEFPGEQPLSLAINARQKFDTNYSASRSIASERHPEVKVTTQVNKNLIDFYNTYPTSMLDGNIMTRWSLYANTPIDENLYTTLYPTLKEILSGKTEIEAVNMLLNLLQTGFVYEYDDKVWGTDRAFFAEETLYYPYCDCEDRAILFTRLVRDLLHLPCVLVYYPGHLAAAVEMSDPEVKGDYLSLDDHKFLITDPTYINAPAGLTMKGMDNKAATVILLR